MELGCASTWNHEEQFVEGDFPYFPYAKQLYSNVEAGDGLTDARLRSNEFSGYKSSIYRKPLYEFIKDSNKMIDATKMGEPKMERENSNALKPATKHELKTAETKKRVGARSHCSRPQTSERKTFNQIWNPQNIVEVQNGGFANPSSMNANGNRRRRSSRREPLKFPPKDSDPMAEIWAHGLTGNRSSIVGIPKTKVARDSKQNEKSTVKLVGPYESNFTGNAFRSISASSWLSKEIEKFIKRKDHRWLDFMKNAGMDVKKYSGVPTETQHKAVAATKKPCIDCAAPLLDEPQKIKTDVLINRIDSLLADLNQFRSSVKNGWSDSGIVKKIRNSESGMKLQDNAMLTRNHRLCRRSGYGRIRTYFRPQSHQPTTATEELESDLRDLRKNVVSCQNRLPDNEMRALENLRLHIKVYVERENNNEKPDCQAIDGENVDKK